MALTIGDNSWTTIKEADDYFSGRLGSLEHWTAELSTAIKEAALITAYHQLNDCGFFSFPSDTTDKMKNGQCEQALFLLMYIEDIDRRKGLQVQGVTAAGIVKEKYGKGLNKVPICINAKNFLVDYSAEGRDIYAIDLARDEEEDVT